ncbi:MAG: phosphatase PAP2 family protein [Paenarthrobacter ureafaciens]|uniref:phosphatase PAP2 family protein n=1 Tax=Paenarthrobacter ureafaciens TaxID=37931 RepID=UPI001ACB4A0E|nr:phosphatase PAP2 family protein [Paenarthrobacter ureafaciens]MBN9130545.1 phosphatase PAP2 family protein [Paenarthrobacter ureafaciens]
MLPASSMRSPARFRPGPPLRPRQRVLFLWAGALFVAGDAIFWLMFAAVLSSSGLATLDGTVHTLLVDSRSPLVNGFLSAVSGLTSPTVTSIAAGLIAVVWAAWKRELWRPAVLLGAMVVSVVLATVVKLEVTRSRPPSTDFLLGPDDALSFPSGHTLGASVLAFVLAYLLCSRSGTRTTTVLAYGAAAVLTLLVAYSRLYLGYHWLTDVVASLGVALGVLGLAVFVDAARNGRGG